MVVPDGIDISDSVRVKYSLRTELLRTAIWKRASFEPGHSNPGYRRSMEGSDLDDAHFADSDLARTADFISSVSAVDGAVVLQRDLILVGFGAEILNTKLPSEDEKIETRRPTGEVVLKPLIDFGMRHRSAYRFCQKVKRAIAFVVSQDGDLRVFCDIGETVRLYEGFTPEDWITSYFR